jgi:phosphonate transport system substrate-binding protein
MKSSTLLSRLVLYCYLLILAGSLAGCGDRHDEPPTNPSPPEVEPAQAPPPQLLIGLIPERDMFKQRAHYAPLAKFISEKAGVTIKLKTLTSHENLATNFVNEKLDGAFLESFTFALLHKSLGIEPIARPVSPDGASTYHGIIFVRKDSGISSGLTMKGKRFAFVAQATMAGYLLPLHYFKDEGIADYHSWFSETYFSGTHKDSIMDVLDKRADVGATRSTVFNRLGKKNTRIADELLILAQSPEVPKNTLSLRHDLDPVIKSKIKNTLLGMSADPNGKIILEQFGAKEFIETKDQDYQSVYQYAEEIGLNLATYDTQ